MQGQALLRGGPALVARLKQLKTKKTKYCNFLQKRDSF